MSVTNPDKYDDLMELVNVYTSFLIDPTVRSNDFMVGYFVALLEKAIKVHKVESRDEGNV